MKRKRGDQLLRDFAAEDARSMRYHTRRLKDDPNSNYDRAMQTHCKGRYNSYKLALQMINTESLWRDK